MRVRSHAAYKSIPLKALLCGAVLAFSATGAQAQGGLAGGAHFKPSIMAQAIEAEMKPKVVGFAYSIAQNGKPVREGGAGPARIELDGYRAHGPMQRQNVASVTKTFTAVAVLQLIEENKSKGVDISVDTRIGAYLPDGWAVGANVADLTFSDLLRHRSGLAVGDDNSFTLLGYEGVKKVVAGGTSPRPSPTSERAWDYDNVNYALLRELVQKLWEQTGEIEPSNVADKASYSSALYMQKLWTGIFQPMGIYDRVKCFDESAVGTLYYPMNPDPKVSGVKPPNQSKFCGSGGMYISTNEMVRFLSYLFNTEKLLPATARDLMVNRRFGLDAISTSRGTAVSRTGIVRAGINAQGIAGLKACMIHFPDGTDVALVQNSPDQADVRPCTVLTAAFETAWK